MPGKSIKGQQTFARQKQSNHGERIHASERLEGIKVERLLFSKHPPSS
jgi:hypothetical protein